MPNLDGWLGLDKPLEAYPSRADARANAAPAGCVGQAKQRISRFLTEGGPRAEARGAQAQLLLLPALAGARRYPTAALGSAASCQHPPQSSPWCIGPLNIQHLQLQGRSDPGISC